MRKFRYFIHSVQFSVLILSKWHNEWPSSMCMQSAAANGSCVRNVNQLNSIVRCDWFLIFCFLLFVQFLYSFIWNLLRVFRLFGIPLFSRSFVLCRSLDFSVARIKNIAIPIRNRSINNSNKAHSSSQVSLNSPQSLRLLLVELVVVAVRYNAIRIPSNSLYISSLFEHGLAIWRLIIRYFFFVLPLAAQTGKSNAVCML